jgi:hypothetical protein
MFVRDPAAASSWPARRTAMLIAVEDKVARRLRCPCRTESGPQLETDHSGGLRRGLAQPSIHSIGRNYSISLGKYLQRLTYLEH